MEEMRICFVGIGSIAQRHIKNIRRIGRERGIRFRIDAYRREKIKVDGVDHIYTAIKDVPCDYHAVFITNPTALHLESLISFHDKGKNFFIEKPVVVPEQMEKAKEFPLCRDKVYYVAAPLRYHAVIQWIKKNVDPRDVISVRSICSSYLPEWRPGQNYKDSYSAHKDMGGGVSIDLIHEWDYLAYLFGWPQKVQSMRGKKSDLEIDSDDYAIYIAEYADRIAELHLDYFGRHALREIQLFTKEDTIIGDLNHNTIRFLRKGDVIDFHEERDDYQIRELLHFFDMVSGKIEAEDGYRHGLRVLQVTEGK